MATQILVVDDSPTDRLFIGHFLRRHPNYTVTFANDGVEAMEIVRSQPMALIVSDQGTEISGLKHPRHSHDKFRLRTNRS